MWCTHMCMTHVCGIYTWYNLSVCVSSPLMGWKLTPKVMALGRSVFERWAGHQAMSKWMGQEPSLLSCEVTVRIVPTKSKQDPIRYQQITHLPALQFRRLVDHRTVFLMFKVNQGGSFLIVAYTKISCDYVHIYNYIYIYLVGIWLIFSAWVTAWGGAGQTFGTEVWDCYELAQSQTENKIGHTIPHNAHLPHDILLWSYERQGGQISVPTTCTVKRTQTWGESTKYCNPTAQIEFSIMKEKDQGP